MKLFWYICCIAFLTSLPALSQEQRDDEGGTSGQSKTKEKEKVDTTKLRISLKMMRSDLLTFDSVPFDTVLYNFHNQLQAPKKFLSYTYLGNDGQALMSNNFFENKSSSDLIFLNAVDYNFIHHSDIKNYKTNHPYTNIAYNASFSSSIDLQDLQFTHTQNVNENFNVGALIKMHDANGYYQYQSSLANAVSLFANYDGYFYSINAVTSYNTLKNELNGGIESDTTFESNKDKGGVYTTNFTDASTKVRNTYVFINQRFNLAGLRDVLDKQHQDSVRKFSGIGLLHNFELERYKRGYYNDPDTISNYYAHIFVDSTATNDTLYFIRVKNSLELLLGKQNPNEAPILIRAGIKSLYDNYKYSIVPDTLYTLNSSNETDTSVVSAYRHVNYNNMAFTGGINVGIKNFFLLEATGDYYFSGYKSGDLYLHGTLTNRFSKKAGTPSFIISADISRYKPGYFYDEYLSNHYAWNNHFDAVKDVRLGFKFTWPAISMDADFNYALLSSPVYFNASAIPQQYNGEVSILEGSLYKGFQFGVFHTSLKGLVQVTSNDMVFPLPAVSAFHSSYVELKLFKNVMTAQAGYEIRYNTAFYGYAYSTDLGVFYNQREKKLGNYPYADVFLNFKLKRMRFYLKFDHVNSDMINRQFYTALHYPLYSRMLIYGLSWNFYD